MNSPARRFTDEERAELAELMREAIRAELGAARAKPVDAPEPAAEDARPGAFKKRTVRAANVRPTPEDYAFAARRRARKD